MQKSTQHAAYEASRRQVEIQPRFFVVVGFLLALASLIILPGVLGTPKVDYTVRRGFMGNPREVDALIVRDETVETAKTYGEARPNVEEGAEVAEGDLVATIYDSSYSSDTARADLEGVRAQILELQESALLQEVNDQSLIQLNARVRDALSEWKDFVRGGTNNSMLIRKAAVISAMDERQEFLKQAASTGDQKLADLYAKEKTLQERINALKTDMYAPRAGRVSFFFDKREQFLRVDNLSDFTVAQVQTLLQGGKMTAAVDARADRPLYRLVNPDVYYVVAYFSSRDPSLVSGAKVKLGVGEEGRATTATVLNVAADGNGQIAVYKVEEDIGSLLGVRKVKVLLGERLEGFIVPESAVFALNEEEGSGYVLTQAGVQIAVRVRMTQNGEALVEPVQEGTLVQGMKLSRSAP